MKKFLIKTVFNASILCATSILFSTSPSLAFIRIFDPDSSGYSRSEIEREKAITPKLQSYPVESFTAATFDKKPWLKDFKYIIVLNKASQGLGKQTVSVYENGQLLNIQCQRRSDIACNKISTGREKFEMKRAWALNHGPEKSYWSNTPTGYFVPQWLSKDHRSKTWRTDMPFAIFYDIKNGLAMHEVPEKGFWNLGNRASGGCTRLHPQTAPWLFSIVESTKGYNIPIIDHSGEPVLDEDGRIIYRNYTLTDAQGNVVFKPGTQKNLQKYPAYGSLIIIQEIVE